MTRLSNIEVDAVPFLDAVTAAAFGNVFVSEAARLHFAKERGDKKLIVVAAAPRSGSTFLANTLSEVTGLPYFRLCTAYSTNEHDLYLPSLCLMNRYGCVSQLHMKGTFHNAALMRAFGITPVLLVRQIDDIVVSLMHDLREKMLTPTFESGEIGYSFLWPDRTTKDLGDGQLLDMIIQLAVPWFVNFYVSWYHLCEQGAVDALWVTYEEMLGDKEATLRRILDFLGLPDIRIDRGLLDRRYGTFREGRRGRGGWSLSGEQRARIRAHFSYYPSVDFRRYCA
jgi:hypothetical protein